MVGVLDKMADKEINSIVEDSSHELSEGLKHFYNAFGLFMDFFNKVSDQTMATVDSSDEYRNWVNKIQAGNEEKGPPPSRHKKITDN